MAQKVALIRAGSTSSRLDLLRRADRRPRSRGRRWAYAPLPRRAAQRGAALIVTTHVLSEAELMADRIAIMRKGVIVTHGSLDDLRQEAAKGRRLSAHLSRTPDPEPLRRWLAEHAVEFHLEGDHLDYSLPWPATVADRAAFAAELQRRLADQDAPFHELEEVETSLRSFI